MTVDDPHNLERFVAAQAAVYPEVLAELAAGEKRSHWMWFIFPQLAGLGKSPTARLYALHSPAEARAYLAHPLLGARLRECTQLVLAVRDRSAYEIFGSPDDLKLRSCLTLFAQAVAPSPAPETRVFGEALARYYGGEPDPRTLELLISSAS